MVHDAYGILQYRERLLQQYLCAVLSSNLVSQRLQVSSRRQHLRATFPKQQLLSELERAHNSLALLTSLLCVALPGCQHSLLQRETPVEEREVGLLVLDEFLCEGGLPQQEELGEKSRFVEPDTLPPKDLKK